MVKAKAETPPPVPIVITDLALLEVAPTNVEIEWHDGKIVSIPMRTLSFGRWVELDRLVPDPMPPVTGGGKSGPVYDYNDAGYLQARTQADERRIILKIADALALPVPGDTLEAKADYIANKMDGMITNSLGVWLRRAFGARLARASARAEQFQPNGTDDTQNLS